VSHAEDVPLCVPFALRGFCSAGARCNRVHTWDCLEFVRTGACLKRAICRLRHWSSRRRDRAQNTPDFHDDESEIDSCASDDNERDEGSDSRDEAGHVTGGDGNSNMDEDVKIVEQDDRERYMSLKASP
jgi:hypothetical protein